MDGFIPEITMLWFRIDHPRTIFYPPPFVVLVLGTRNRMVSRWIAALPKDAKACPKDIHRIPPKTKKRRAT
jgi:hypothetical protein